MLDVSHVEEFEWDAGNQVKSYQKHGVTPRQAEEVFSDEQLFLEPDVKHSGIENRYIAFGRETTGIPLFVVFTMRKYKIRIISARKMNKKEKNAYEKAIKTYS